MSKHVVVRETRTGRELRQRGLRAPSLHELSQVGESSATPFSIPVTINAGEATYIGNFARAPSLGASLEPQLGAVGYFVVSDQSERDLAIARARDPALPPVRVEVADVSNLGQPMLYAEVQN